MSDDHGLNTASLVPGVNFGMRECRRYITGHDASGKAIYLDSPPLLWAKGGDAIAGSHSYAVDKVPADLTGEEDLNSYLSSDPSNPVSHLVVRATVPGGVNWVVTNLAPGAQTRMHRTVSVDSTICVEGHVAMDVDSGDRRELLPGDHVIQRGTNHRWINLSNDKPARLVGITVAINPLTIAGKTLKEEYLVDA